MHDVILRNAADRCSQLSQYVSEQPEVDVHVNRFVNDRLKLARLLFKCNNARLARCATGRQHFASQPCILRFLRPVILRSPRPVPANAPDDVKRYRNEKSALRPIIPQCRTLSCGVANGMGPPRSRPQWL
jgi:hypothetical protein